MFINNSQLTQYWMQQYDQMDQDIHTAHEKNASQK